MIGFGLENLLDTGRSLDVFDARLPSSGGRRAPADNGMAVEYRGLNNYLYCFGCS